MNKLGRIQPKLITDSDRFRTIVTHDGRVKVVPRLSVHYDPAKDAAPPPDSIDWSPKALASLSHMYLNDRLGDCVIAGKAHSVGVWSGNESGNPVIATDAEIQQNYTSICGPGDNGCVITDVLDAMKAGKFIMAGAPALIDNYAAIDWTNKTLVMVALEVFGTITIGVNLTDDCTNSGPGVTWNFAGHIVGGHDITIYSYDSKGVYISTWGTIGTLIPWAVFLKNAGRGPGVEEAYVPLAPTWYDNGNLAPNGINKDTLAQDLALVQGGQTPPGPGPTPPNPPPPAGNTVSVTAEVPAGPFTVTDATGNAVMSGISADVMPGSYPLSAVQPPAASGTVTITATLAAGTYMAGGLTMTATADVPPGAYQLLQGGKAAAGCAVHSDKDGKFEKVGEWGLAIGIEKAGAGADAVVLFQDLPSGDWQVVDSTGAVVGDYKIQNPHVPGNYPIAANPIPPNVVSLASPRVAGKYQVTMASGGTAGLLTFSKSVPAGAYNFGTLSSLVKEAGVTQAMVSAAAGDADIYQVCYDRISLAWQRRYGSIPIGPIISAIIAMLQALLGNLGNICPPKPSLPGGNGPDEIAARFRGITGASYAATQAVTLCKLRSWRAEWRLLDAADSMMRRGSFPAGLTPWQATEVSMDVGGQSTPEEVDRMAAYSFR